MTWINFKRSIGNPWEKNCHGELTESSPWAHSDQGVHGSGPNDHGSVTARRGHRSVTARSQLTVRSQLNHDIFSMITAQSRLGHSSITAQVTAQSRLAVTILVTVNSRWAHGELTVSSHGGHFFFSWEVILYMTSGIVLRNKLYTDNLYFYDGWNLEMHT